MAVLINKTKQKELFSQLQVAETFSIRAKGLMGKSSLPMDHALFFPRCNWIHTFFMMMPIDVIYVDKKMKVQKIQKNLKPWRWPAPVFKAHSVIEMSAGLINQDFVEVGDTLYVGH